MILATYVPNGLLNGSRRCVEWVVGYPAVTERRMDSVMLYMAVQPLRKETER